MLSLLEFLSRNRNFIVFVLLEVFCFWLISRSNTYWGATYFNTSNYYVAKVLSVSNAVREYTNLKVENENLAEENVKLNELVTLLRQQNTQNAPIGYYADSVYASRFKFTVAKAIKSELYHVDNYITIDKGTKDGIRPGMGVLSPTGIVGRVRSCSENFSVVTSILHSQFMISTRLTSSNEIGTAKWSGNSTESIDLDDISRYKPVAVGDTAVTSNFNSVFPPDIMVGIVKNVKVRADQTFFDIELTLSTDFRNLSYVYIVENKMQKQESDLEKSIRTK
jgi:rod shape-determining protein MreC